MTGILDHMRTMTPDTLAGVRSDFDDLPAPVYVSRQPKNMVRIVEGATDLQVNRPAPKNPGMVRTADWNAPAMGDYPGEAGHNGDTCNGPCCDDSPAPVRPAGMSVRQREVMFGLVEQLDDLNAEDYVIAARKYIDKMDAANAWTPGKEGNASRWIGNLIKKVRELKARPVEVTAPANAAADASFQDIPNGYYAVGDAGPDDIHFFRISRFRDGGIKVQEQASDTLHPVRRGGRRTAILTTILHVGPAAASALYGQTIGRCGRCNRTLTDATSRARGIGPDCWDKM